MTSSIRSASVLAVIAGLSGCGDNAAGNGKIDAGKHPDSAAPIDGSGSGSADAASDAASDAAPDGPPLPVVLNANGDFETGDQTGWICSGNAACSVINAGAHGGTYAGKATNLPNDYSGFRINILPLVCPTDPTCATGTDLRGRTLRFHGFIMPVGAGTTAARLVLRWNCPPQSMGNYDWLQNINNPTADTWNEYTRDFLIPNCDYQGTDGNLYLYTGTVGATEIHVDDLTIIDVSP